MSDRASLSGRESMPVPATASEPLLRLGSDLQDDVLRGGQDNDTLAGGQGNDVIYGESGDDILRGDDNSPTPGYGHGGDDVLYGGDGNDRLGGKEGDDILYGDAGNDELWGDNGDDVLRGGLGDDVLVGDDFSGGTGRDTFVLALGEGTDTILDFEVGTDVIGLADGLSFEDLSLVGNTLQQGGHTLAVLTDVVTPTLTAESFVIL